MKKRHGTSKKFIGIKAKLDQEQGGEVLIYQSPGNSRQIEVRLDGDTIWLTQQQIAQLFNKSRVTITEHIGNIFKNNELKENSVCRNFRHTAKDGKTYEVRQYNLDVIISVGYRVNSVRGTQFRIWATQRLKDYLIKGYAINERHLLQSAENLRRIEGLVETIKGAKKEGRMKIEDSDTIVNLISSYAKAITLFNEVDTDSLKRQNLDENIIYEINYEDAIKVVEKMRIEVENRGQSNFRFGLEDGDKFKSAIGAVSQTFGGKYLYPSIEEQAANLLYLIVEGHALKDGNKRNGSLLFIWFLEKNNYRFKNSGELKINDNALVVLSLLLAESKGMNKEFYIDLIINLISNR